MPRITCPTCGSTLQVTADMIGGDVQCGNCQAVFVAREGRPSARSSRRDPDEDEDDRPSRRRRREDDEDDESRPRRRAEATNGLAIASMIVGILALLIELPSIVVSLGGVAAGVCCCCPVSLITWMPHAVGALGGGVGLTLGLFGLKGQSGKGMAIAGVATSGVAILIALLGVVLSILGLAVGIPPPANNPGFNQQNNPPFNQPNRPIGPNPRR